MLATISKWGNSRALRIPKQMALDSGLDFGSKVELILEEDNCALFRSKSRAIRSRSW